MGAPAPKVIIMIPSCLRVERAIIFFMSISKIAAPPATSIVRAPRNINTSSKENLIKSVFIRINRYTPAVTRVEECTSADTGVGAAIAAGSQAEKGIWALLVQADRMIVPINLFATTSLLSL